MAEEAKETTTKKRATKKSSTKTTTEKKSEEPKGRVIKMLGFNPIKEVVVPQTKNKYRFTQQHRYVLVENETDIDFLMNLEGFSTASPSEVAEYYGVD